jgi:hypothetical protein
MGTSAFRMRDLLITSLPIDGGVLDCDGGCSDTCDGGVTKDCPGGCSNASTKFSFWEERGDPPPDYTEVQYLMRVALAHSAGGGVAKKMEPQSLEEVDLLEGQLKAALEHLEAHRKRLSHKKR